MKIKELITSLQQFAPLQLQESYDNSGLIIGDKEDEVKGVLLCTDVTDDILREAVANNCNLIISHHPLIFDGLKKVSSDNRVGRLVIEAIRNDLAIYACHTNLDSISNGVSDVLCDRIGLQDRKVLFPRKGLLRKLVTFCPEDKAEEVRSAIFSAGAGHIGEYNSCSFSSSGIGSFQPTDNTNPYVGEKNQLHLEKESRIETIFPSYYEQKVIRALIEAHPYEEVAYDIYQLENIFDKVGYGTVGVLNNEMKVADFLTKIKTILNIDYLRHSGFDDERVKKVAVCGGAGAFLLPQAIDSGADVFITSEIKHNQFFDAKKQLILVDAGHFETEQFAKDLLYDVIKKKNPKFAVLISKVEKSPVCFY